MGDWPLEWIMDFHLFCEIDWMVRGGAQPIQATKEESDE
jgi:hypothetical protein